MMKVEFEERIKDVVSLGEWEVIHQVYQFHPVITDVKGKDQVVALYQAGGMTVFYDMLPRALLAETFDRKLQDLENRSSLIRGQLNRLATGPIPENWKEKENDSI